MYKVKLNNRTLRNKTFNTYDQARSFVRSNIRKKESKEMTESSKRAIGWDSISRNPVKISTFGYQIVKASGASAKASAVNLDN